MPNQPVPEPDVLYIPLFGDAPEADMEDVIVGMLRAAGFHASNLQGTARAMMRQVAEDIAAHEDSTLTYGRGSVDQTLDEIDRLIDSETVGGLGNGEQQPKCPVCQRNWHGLVGTGRNGMYGCPGEYGTEAAKAEFLQRLSDEKARREAVWDRTFLPTPMRGLNSPGISGEMLGHIRCFDVEDESDDSGGYTISGAIRTFDENGAVTGQFEIDPPQHVSHLDVPTYLTDLARAVLPPDFATIEANCVVTPFNSGPSVFYINLDNDT